MVQKAWILTQCPVASSANSSTFHYQSKAELACSKEWNPEHFEGKVLVPERSSTHRQVIRVSDTKPANEPVDSVSEQTHQGPSCQDVDVSTRVVTSVDKEQVNSSILKRFFVKKVQQQKKRPKSRKFSFRRTTNVTFSPIHWWRKWFQPQYWVIITT